MESDIITEIRGVNSHENEFLASLVSTKVAEAKKEALEGAYSKPRVVYGQLMASLQADPETSMGMGKFYLLQLSPFFLHFLYHSRIGHKSEKLCTELTEEVQEILW